MSTAAALEREYERRELQLFRYALINGVATADDALARAASGGRYTAAELVRRIRELLGAGKDAELRELVRGLRPQPFRHLATLQAAQTWRPGRESDAAALLEAMVVFGGREALSRVDRGIFLELLASSNRPADLDRFVTDFDQGEVGLVQAHLLRANATRPFSTGSEDASSPGVDAWLELVNWMFVRDGLEPIGLAPGEEAPLDRILCAPSSLVEDGPLVTIIMPTHNPGLSLTTALESLRAQSYRPLEILVMDDGSRAEIAGSLDDWESRDPRIRVVHLAENRGPYSARNAAASTYSRGDFITVHDDDDWSHPRKIELQLADLLANPDVPANMSLGVRVTPDLRMVRRNRSPKYAHSNFSSLLIRRSVMDRLGNWDLVNRGADGEMRYRIVAATGAEVAVAPRAPMALLRMGEKSLTFGELNRGYTDPRRRWYNMAARAWHQRMLSNGADPYLPPDDSTCRPFPVPLGMVGMRAAQALATVDVLYATDYRLPSTPAFNEIDILLSSGLAVGMLQLDSPAVGESPQLQPRALDLASHPHARVLTVKDAAQAGLTIVRHPDVLQFLEPERAPVSTGRLVLVVDQPPVNPDGETALYDLDTATSNCDAIFAATTVLAPTSTAMRGLLERQADPGRVAASDWSSVVRLAGGPAREVEPSRPPRLGRHSCDQPLRWPRTEVLRLVYPADGSRDVRVLGDIGGAEDRLGKRLDGVWTCYPPGSRPVADFLAELDFWVDFQVRDLDDALGIAALDALAAGLVVILPERMQTTFGDGAVYTNAERAGALMDSLWADPSAYRRQSELAISTVKDRFGEASLLARVAADIS